MLLAVIRVVAYGLFMFLNVIVVCFVPVSVPRSVVLLFLNNCNQLIANLF